MSDEPQGLPETKGAAPAKGYDTHCDSCGQELRIVSNYLGRRANCILCKTSIPISGRVDSFLNEPDGRGLSRQARKDKVGSKGDK